MAVTRGVVPVARSLPGESEDALLGGRLRLRQPRDGYRVAIDPPLLAAAVPARPGERILDLGCGTGAAGLCLLARVPGLDLVGLELDQERLALARANAALNGYAEDFVVMVGDLRSPPPRLTEQAFDHVLCNPPYLEASRGCQGSAGSATHEGEARLADWVAAALGLVRVKGSVTFIHRADRLAELLQRLNSPAGEIVIFPLWPRAGQAAKRVIVRARKGVATPLRLAPGLVLHRRDGRFTAAAEAILREAGALAI